MNPATRAAALDEIDSLGVHSLRVILNWRAVAPGAGQQDAPEVRADRSRRLRLGRVRPAHGGDQGARLVGAHDGHRAGADLGDGGQARRPHAPQPVGVRRVHDRGRAQVRRPGRHVGDLERAQPAAVPAPAVRRRRQGALAGDLPQPLPRRPARAEEGRPGRRHDPARRDVAARQLERRPAAALPARDAVPQQRVQEAREVRSAATPTATPTTPTRRARARTSSRTARSARTT